MLYQQPNLKNISHNMFNIFTPESQSLMSLYLKYLTDGHGRRHVTEIIHSYCVPVQNSNDKTTSLYSKRFIKPSFISY